MNLGMVQRAVRRHRHMKTRPAYVDFLTHVSRHGEVWKVPQREIAAWWERRQAARLDLLVTRAGRLAVSCSLGECAVEVDGGELRIPPFEIEVSSELPAGNVRLTYSHKPLPDDFLLEVLGHLGYGHLTAAGPESPVDIGESELGPVLARLRQQATESKRYTREDIESLRALLRRAHHRRGIPDLRLWSLPRNGGGAYRAAVSTRYDVDKAIVNLPAIHRLEAEYGLRSTVYLRPMGFFYGPAEIRRYRASNKETEIALHGEFVTTAGKEFGDEFKAAVAEKERLESLIGEEISGVCMHGGELRTNTTLQTRDAIERAGFKYETMYRNDYYFPLHLPTADGVRRTLSLGQHFADITVEPGPGFSERLTRAFVDRFSEAAAQGGIFVPVMHPLYFSVANYIRYPANVFHLLGFLPRFFWTAARMKRSQQYANPV